MQMRKRRKRKVRPVSRLFKEGLKGQFFSEFLALIFLAVQSHLLFSPIDVVNQSDHDLPQNLQEHPEASPPESPKKQPHRLSILETSPAEIPPPKLTIVQEKKSQVPQTSANSTPNLTSLQVLKSISKVKQKLAPIAILGPASPNFSISNYKKKSMSACINSISNSEDYRDNRFNNFFKSSNLFSKNAYHFAAYPENLNLNSKTKSHGYEIASKNLTSSYPPMGNHPRLQNNKSHKLELESKRPVSTGSLNCLTELTLPKISPRLPSRHSDFRQRTKNFENLRGRLLDLSSCIPGSVACLG